jgi:CheY-like chemotaxis protein
MAEIRTVVVVEDEHAYKELLSGQLARRGIHTETWGCRGCAECGDDQPFAGAVNFIRNLAADPGKRLVAIVLDANEFRNDTTSINVILPALKADAALKGIPVIVYSAKQLAALGRKAVAAGACCYYNRYDTTPRKAAEIIADEALP